MTSNNRQEMYLANIQAAANGDSVPYTLTPVWRVEHFLNNIVLAFQHETLESLNAATREEQWLKNIVDAIGGNALSFTLSPAWRVEMWYANIIDAIHGDELTYDLTPVWETEAWYADIIETIQNQQPTSAVGQWLWNEQLTVFAGTTAFVLDFTSYDKDGNAFAGNKMTVTNMGSGIVRYEHDDTWSQVYIGKLAGWQNSASRSITITGGDDAENADLIAYLTANATRVS
jgi:hypothetical protein